MPQPNSDPVVFLDMDGVICTRRGAGWSIHGRPLVHSCRRLPVRAIDPSTVLRLNELCAVTGAVVVISSTWRIRRDVPQILRARGFTGRCHVDWCTDADGRLRSDEIARWLDAHGGPPHVVIDDKAGELVAFEHRLVLTSNYCGLRQCDVERAVELLGEQGGSCN
ncbi:HAD domain-containing protein [Pseudomonas fluorescens]|uniref:HAD domain-containing protein n=1 Tax=Pseudomonas fluorescens TaxID=294 RepID=UPI0012B8C475|nr:HAD domain-containing protein [Pseudomonas fluorescens]